MIDVWRIMSRWICSIIYLYILQRLWLQQPGLGGGAGILWVQVTGIEWGQKWKPKKSLGLPTKSKQMALSKINTQKSYAEFLASHSGIFREQLVFQSCCLVGSQPNTSSPKIACVKDFWISEPLKFQKSMDITRKITTLEIECFSLLIYHTIWSYLSASGSHFNSTRDSQEHLGFFITNLQIVWNTPQKSPVKSSRPKKYLPHFPSKKNRKRKFQTHHNPLIIPVWLEIPSTTLRSAVFIFFWYKIQLFGCYCAKLSQTGKSALGTRLLSQRDFTSFDVPIV